MSGGARHGPETGSGSPSCRRSAAAFSHASYFACALAELPGDAGLDLLIETARHFPSQSIREEAIDHLAEKVSERVTATLEDVVYLDDHRGVREEALEALAELPGGGGLAILVKVARTHPDAATREQAIEVLGDLGEHDERARRALRMLGSG